MIDVSTELEAETGCTTAELWIVDLAEFASVRRFCDKFEQKGGRLDILVANAAVVMPKYERTADGWETSSVFKRAYAAIY